MRKALPNHVAVIMDGNGRWAKARFMPRVEGHRRGIKSLRSLVSAARKFGIKNLSVFAFSSENWKRPEQEVNALMGFFSSTLKSEAVPMRDAGVRMCIVGDRTAFSESLQKDIAEAERITRDADGMILNICINYGGCWDIAQAAAKVAARGEAITEESIGRELCMPWSGPVDLMIRTGGEQRISNFILWQAAYAELYFSDTLWPEYGEKDLEEALDWFAPRQRRFGMTGEQVA